VLKHQVIEKNIIIISLVKITKNVLQAGFVLTHTPFEDVNKEKPTSYNRL